MPYKDKEKQKESQHQHYLRNRSKFSTRTANRRFVNRQYVVDIKSKSCCVICRNDNYRCLEFHHCSDDKVVDIAHGANDLTLHKLQDEISKCVILCANCHQLIHQKDKVKSNSRKILTRNFEFINKYKKRDDVYCIRCGESKWQTLVFHHRDQNTKDKCVSRGVAQGWSIKRIQKEIDKCDVLCRNCHLIEHYSN